MSRWTGGLVLLVKEGWSVSKQHHLEKGDGPISKPGRAAVIAVCTEPMALSLSGKPFSPFPAPSARVAFEWMRFLPEA